MRTVLAAILMGVLLVSTPSGVVSQDVAFHGQVRPRFEMHDQSETERRTFTSMRVRADLLAKLEQGVQVFIQLQDVRLWGEESSTLADFRADNFDLHQGFVAMAFADGAVTAKIGRQETNLGGQRLIGAVGWTPQGRSFDGLRVSTNDGWGSVDLLAYQLREGTTTEDSDAGLFGAYGVLDAGGMGNADVYVLYNADAQELESDQVTLGTRIHGSARELDYRAEASLQRGHRAGDDVSAFMFGVRVARAFNEGKGRLTLWYDHLSGDDAPDDGTTRVFDTLFGTNHKFYGFADLFLNIPVHTGGLGLRDAAVKGSYQVGQRKRLAAALHHFRTDKQGALESPSLGQELDLTYTYGYTANVGVTAGHSVVWATDALEALGRAVGTKHFGYLMLNVTF